MPGWDTKGAAELPSQSRAELGANFIVKCGLLQVRAQFCCHAMHPVLSESPGPGPGRFLVWGGKGHLTLELRSQTFWVRSQGQCLAWQDVVLVLFLFQTPWKKRRAQCGSSRGDRSHCLWVAASRESPRAPSCPPGFGAAHYTDMLMEGLVLSQSTACTRP